MKGNGEYTSLRLETMVYTYFAVALPSFGITTSPFNVPSWIVIPVDGALCVM